MNHSCCPYHQNCRHGVIIERRKQRLEFAIKHKELILAGEYEWRKQRRKIGFTLQLPPIASMIVQMLKREVPYSCKTLDWDIFMSLTNLLKKYLATQ